MVWGPAAAQIPPYIPAHTSSVLCDDPEVMSELTTSFGRVSSNNVGPPVSAFVRVSGPPNSNFLVGYPGISATLVMALLAQL